MITKSGNDYYSYFTTLVDFLKTNNFEVINFSDELPDDICGRIYYFKNQIHINAPSAKDGFFTLLHEAGHWLSYKRYIDGLLRGSKDEQVREKYSYLFGWIIVKQLDIPISKEEYKLELGM